MGAVSKVCLLIMNKMYGLLLLLFSFFSVVAYSGVEYYQEAFHAIENGKTEDAIFYIDKIENKNKSFDERAAPKLITEAARKNNFRIVKLLLDAGVDIDSMNGDAYTALLYSVKNGNSEMFEYLIKHNADLCAVTKWGDSIVDLAKEKDTKFYNRVKQVYDDEKCSD